MGKQIRFFATEKDLLELTETIRSYGGILLNENGENSDCIADGKAFVKIPTSRISYKAVDGVEVIDTLRSEIIELIACSPSQRYTVDTSSVDEQFRKNGFVVVDDAERFNRLMKELLEDPTYIDNPNYVPNGFEHGRLWYNNNPFDNGAEGSHKQMDALFAKLAKYIKKNYRATKSKFGYIGNDAYNEYLMGRFVPCSGKVIIRVE